ncbi:MAG TPA: branched-chain alpha-keto acid dehydrogenase subunit E2 [Myxococcales bacterium]|nr:branched-chain alpha-keto acid dehydrogenase subunit E2 [Myxococcales bacterium]
MAQEILIRVPDIGDFEAVEVVEILVAPGDVVQVEDPLVSIESDKATMEIPSPVAGRVHELRVSLGDSVSEGSVLAVLLAEELSDAEQAEVAPESEGASSFPAPSPAPSPAPPPAPSPPAFKPPHTGTSPVSGAERVDAPVAGTGALGASSGSSSGSGDSGGAAVHASPGVRRYARQLGVDLARTSGSGPLGRVLETDVTGHVHAAMTGGASPNGGGVPPVPDVDFSRFGPVREEPLAKIRRVSARNLSRSWLNAPHVTQHDEADITELEAFRRTCKAEAAQRGLKLSPLHFVLKAVARVLAEFPDFRSSLAPGGEGLIVKDYFHLGVAVDTENGLVVPVIRDVETKGIFELAGELSDLAERARTRKLGPADLQGACFSLSSLGGIGGTAFTPIVNVPEVAILGLSKLRVQPRWSGGNDPLSPGEFEGRAVLPLSLSYDHRVIDGAAAARFTTRLATVLAHPGHLLL